MNNKIMMLGAMAELGEESLNEHREIIDLIKKYDWEKVVLVGGDFLKLDSSFLLFKSSAEAKEWLQQQHFTNRYFLIKGSRSMQMEKVLDA